jgi:hypothetical protein
VQQGWKIVLDNITMVKDNFGRHQRKLFSKEDRFRLILLCLASMFFGAVIGRSFWSEARRATSRQEATKQVFEVYNKALGRNPDLSGLQNYVHLLESGMSAQDMEQDMRHSEEGQHYAAALRNSQTAGHGRVAIPTSSHMIPFAHFRERTLTAPRFEMVVLDPDEDNVVSLEVYRNGFYTADGNPCHD